MKYKRLGRSGINVSQVCLGSNNFGGTVDRENSEKIVKKAIDLGTNLIDTANTYTDGKSEEIIGNVVRDYRDEIILATKVGFPVREGPNGSGLSRKHILTQFKRSLERLKTDYVDIYYLHCPDPETPLEESLRTMNELLRQGKVLYSACSNFTVWQIAEVNRICEVRGLDRLIAVQPQYNLMHREIERDLLPYCREEQLGVLTYSPLMAGFLTGKYTKDSSPPADSRRARYFEMKKSETNYGILEQIKTLAKTCGLSPFQLAVAWILRNPIVTAPIIGASKPEHIDEICRMPEIKISDETYEKLNEITNR